MAVLDPRLPLTTTGVGDGRRPYLPEMQGPPDPSVPASLRWRLQMGLVPRRDRGAQTTTVSTSAKQMPDAEPTRARPSREVLVPTRCCEHRRGVMRRTSGSDGLVYTAASARRIIRAAPHVAERRLVVRSLAFAASQEKHLRQRVARAVTEINALDERKQGSHACLTRRGVQPPRPSWPNIALMPWCT